MMKSVLIATVVLANILLVCNAAPTIEAVLKNNADNEELAREGRTVLMQVGDYTANKVADKFNGRTVSLLIEAMLTSDPRAENQDPIVTENGLTGVIPRVLSQIFSIEPDNKVLPNVMRWTGVVLTVIATVAYGLRMWTVYRGFTPKMYL